MKCSKAQKLVNDHIDNLLDADKVRRLESHLDECETCRGFLSDMKSIVSSAKGLDTLDPSDDLWPVIKREVLKQNRKGRIERKHPFWNLPMHSKGPVFALGTFFGIIVLIPLLFYGLPHIRNTNIGPGKTALSNYDIAEQYYQSAIEALDQAIAAQDVKLNPELLAVFKENLAIIDDSIRVCKASIEKSPGTRETNKLLLVCYRKKIDLLNEIKEITLRT